MRSARLQRTAHRCAAAAVVLLVAALGMGGVFGLMWIAAVVFMWCGIFAGNAQCAYREADRATEEEIDQKLSQEGFK